MNKAPAATRAPFSFFSASRGGASPDFDAAGATDLGAAAFHPIVLRARARIALSNRETILGLDCGDHGAGIGEFGDDLRSLPLARQLRIAVCWALAALDLPHE
jgi:hypothetical protein